MGRRAGILRGAVAQGQPRPGTVERSGSGDVTIHLPTAEAHASASIATVTTTEAATGRDHAEVLRDAERKAAEYAREPNHSYTWIVTDERGTPPQSGVADDWDDAKLASIMNLYPPLTGHRPSAGTGKLRELLRPLFDQHHQRLW